MKKLYIDIDGVLLTSKHTAAAENAAQLITFVTANFDCYWLTTHCKGNTEAALRYLAAFFDETMLTTMRTVQPTNWTTLKTEGIDLESDFIWLEDYPLQSELKVLEHAGKTDALILVDLRNPGELLRIISLLENLLYK